MESRVDLSVPSNLPLGIQYQLNELIQDYKQENLTIKGYQTKRRQLLENYELQTNSSKISLSSSLYSRDTSTIDLERPNDPSRFSNSRPTSSYVTSTKGKERQTNTHYRSFSDDLMTSPNYNTTSRLSNIIAHKTMRQNSVYRVTTMNSASKNSLPLASPAKFKRKSQYSLASSVDDASLSGQSEMEGSYTPMIPLLPRKPSYVSPENKEVETIAKEFLPSILRKRFEYFNGQTAMISINNKGKETFITWDKLYLRAAKVAHELTKEQLYKMDKVLLWYNMEDSIEFAVALFGCFIAGMVAVPVSFQTYSLSDIIEIIRMTGAKLILISNNCQKQLDNLHSTSNHNKVKLVKSEVFKSVKFLKTDDLGIYSKAKKSVPIFETPNIMYIEFTRTPLGRLSGVVMKHKVLMDQLSLLALILNSRVMPHWKRKNNVIVPLKQKSLNVTSVADRFVVMSSLDPTRSSGLIFGVLFNLFSGALLIAANSQILQTPGGYEHLIDKYRADVLLNDQLQLKQVVINYLENPELTLTKKHKIDFSCIKYCLTSCNTIDTDVTDMVIHKWLKNLGCIDASLCYSPMLTLTDFGGLFFSLRDELGNLDNFPVHDSKLRLQDELYISREKLKKNIIEPSVTAMINSSSSFKDYLKVEPFGFPIPGSILCVVDPDDNTLVNDLTVGEIWISSDKLTDEFYQMDKINEFVFKAKLNFNKMFAFAKSDEYIDTNDDFKNSLERVETIYNICPKATHFLRTKLMGFVFNGKIYVLSLVEDMFLQNRLVRLPNWAHTSNLLHTKPEKKDKNYTSELKDSAQSSLHTRNREENKKLIKRSVESHYLQQITETLVRTVNTVFEAVTFELNHHKEEHFLVLVVESSLARDPRRVNYDKDEHLLEISNKEKFNTEKKMNELTDQIFRILWIFHKIQPMCVLVVPRNTLPRRYCSLELATSTVVKKFYNGELDDSFAKFQFDNVILDYIPHSSYYNESIFSEHLSALRFKALKEAIDVRQDDSMPYENDNWQASGINFKDFSIDDKSGKSMKSFHSILEILEFRISASPNDLAFNDGGSSSKTTSGNTSNNIHKKVSWKAFEVICASFLRKIVVSKTPLKPSDCVIIMADNSVEYIAMIYACFYCNFIVIPVPSVTVENANKIIGPLVKIIKNYKVKRIFMDAKNYVLVDSHNIVSKIFKTYKQNFPKITVFSKVKRKNTLTLSIFKKTLREKYSLKGKKHNNSPCFVWTNLMSSTEQDIHPTMTHSTFLKTCKILKETLNMSNDRVIFSLCPDSSISSFTINNLLGVFIGCPTNLFNISDFKNDPVDFLIGIQNLNVKEIYLPLSVLSTVLEKANQLLENNKKAGYQNTTKKNSNSTSLLRSDFLRNVQNLIIPFSGRPNSAMIEKLLKRYSNVMISTNQICCTYEHKFNPIISMQTGIDTIPKYMYLDPTALREGIIDEISLTEVGSEGYIRIQDSGCVPYCTDVTIVNPETEVPCIDGEYGEIWCCSEANVYSYYLSDKKLRKDPFITSQFSSKLKGEADKGLTYLRTGDFGFIKSVNFVDHNGVLNRKKLLFILGSMNETVEILGLTHFVIDLEQTVKNVHSSISDCYIAKMGGLLVCLIRTRDRLLSKYANLCALITSSLLDKHGVILDMCAFVRVPKFNDSTSPAPPNWSKERLSLFKRWLQCELQIDSQFGINYGENISMYLLSEFENN